MSELRPALILFVLLTLLTGVVYPLVVTGIGQVLFPTPGERQRDRSGRQSGGLATDRPAVLRPKYFWGRPSATAPQPYNGGASSGSNQGPMNPALVTAVR